MYNKYLMKNFAFLILAALLVLAHGAESDYLPGVGTSSPTQISYGGALITTTKCNDYTLSAGNTFLDYGTVRVCNTKQNLYIGVYADAGFTGIEAIKIWVGTSLSLLPLPKKSSRPIAGKFDYKSPEFTEITYYWSIQIPFTGIKKLDTDPVPTCAGATIFVYVHVDALDGNTAWGGIQCVGSGSDTAWYCSITYTTKCPQLVVEGPDCTQAVKPAECPKYSCQTAFAQGNWLLSNINNVYGLPYLNGGNGRWGWAYKSLNTFCTANYQIYAGAGQNDITKGYLVGNVTYTWDPATQYGKTQVRIDNFYYVKAMHIHINDTLPKFVASPGGYEGCLPVYAVQQHLPYFLCTSEQLTDTQNDGIWFITHIEVCTLI